MKRFTGRGIARIAAVAATAALHMAGPASAQCQGQWAEGFHLSGLDGDVSASVVFNDGGGPALYAGGSFTTAGGVGANYIAKWDGSEWSVLGTGMNGSVFALTVFDDGGGPALYTGGSFTTVGGGIAKWDGSEWSALGTGMNHVVDAATWVAALTVFDDGGGPGLYAGGVFTTAGGVVSAYFAKWRVACPPAVLYVSAGAAGANDGSSWEDAFTSLQDALAAAPFGPADSGGGVEIWVSRGTYTPDGGSIPPGGAHVPGSGDRTATFQLLDGVAIYGGFAGTETLLSERDVAANETTLSGDLSADDMSVACTNDSPDCGSFGLRCIAGTCVRSDNDAENAYHVVSSSGNDATAVIDGFTITGGNADGGGSDSRGGGMNIITGSPTVSNCHFVGSAAAFVGSAISVVGAASTPLLANLTILNNTTGSGGGALSVRLDGAATVVDCLLLGNASGSRAGGIWAETGGTVEVVNSVFTDNYAFTDGGAVVVEDATSMLSLRNCTVSRNRTPGDIGGFGSNSGGVGIVANCIFWGNADSGGMDEPAQISGGGAIAVDHTVIQGLIPAGTFDNGTNIDVDPLFVDPDGPDNIPGTLDDDLRLRAGSPAIDAGDNTAVPADAADLDGDVYTAERTPLDLAGNTRFFDDPATADTGVADPPDYPEIVDMGAFEYFPDCNGNGVEDSIDIAMGTSQDCDSGGWASNGVPDECDIEACTGDTGCDDCNQNGVPDGCDIGSGSSLDTSPADGIPDECASFSAECTDVGVEDHWTCFDNWDLGGAAYPDDVDSAAGVAVTLDEDNDVFLDEDVTIPSLRLRTGSELRLTESGEQGDLDFSSPAALSVRGNVVVEGPRSIGANSTPPPNVTIRSEGVYAAGAGPTSALMVVNDLRVTADDCPTLPCPEGGTLELTDTMSLFATGSVTLDGSAANGPCESPDAPLATASQPPGTTAALFGHTPPIKRIRDSAVATLDASFTLLGAATLLVASTEPVLIGGDFNNQGVRPECFDWVDGAMVLDGDSPQTFEVAATDTGPVADWATADFAIGSVTVAESADVTFQDLFDNDGQSQSPCSETQYIGTLTVEANATVTFDNCRVYYDTASIDPTATVVVTGCGEHRSVMDPVPPAPEEPSTERGRFLAFVVPAGASGETALRVRLSSLHHPDSPANAPDFSSFENRFRYVNTFRDEFDEPVFACSDSGSHGPYFCAALGCAPEYRDWAGDFASGPIHVTGPGVTPSSIYDLAIVAGSCRDNESTCTAVSEELAISTALWGDIVGPGNGPPDGMTNVLDIGAAVDKVKGLATAFPEPRVWHKDPDPSPDTDPINVLDIGFVVDAVKGLPYPFAISACP